MSNAVRRQAIEHRLGGGLVKVVEGGAELRERVGEELAVVALSRRCAQGELGGLRCRVALGQQLLHPRHALDVIGGVEPKAPLGADWAQQPVAALERDDLASLRRRRVVPRRGRADLRARLLDGPHQSSVNSSGDR